MKFECNRSGGPHGRPEGGVSREFYENCYPKNKIRNHRSSRTPRNSRSPTFFSSFLQKKNIFWPKKIIFAQKNIFWPKTSLAEESFGRK